MVDLVCFVSLEKPDEPDRSRTKCGVEAPSGVEPLHRSFAVRPTTLRPLTIQRDRLRRQKSEIKGFDVFVATDCDWVRF